MSKRHEIKKAIGTKNYYLHNFLWLIGLVINIPLVVFDGMVALRELLPNRISCIPGWLYQRNAQALTKYKETKQEGR